MLKKHYHHQIKYTLILLLLSISSLDCHQPSMFRLSNQWDSKYHLIKVKIADTAVIEDIDQDPAAQNLIRQIRSHPLHFVSNVGPGYLWIIADDQQLNTLRQKNYTIETILTATELQLHRRLVWGPGMTLPTGYHTYDQIVSQLKTIHQQHPDITHIQTIGKTQQFQQDILALKLSDNASQTEDQPRVLFSAAIHGNEVMGPHLTLALLRDLLDKHQNQNQKALQYINNTEIWFIPVINVDGYTLATTIHPNWRKNAQDNDGDGVFSPADGADLNRNFDFNFDTSGQSEPASKFYRGPHPFSESETKHLANFVKKQKFTFSFTYHSAESRVYYPWRQTIDNHQIYTPDDDLLTHMAQTIANSIPCINENYTFQPVRNTIDDSYTNNYYYAELGTFDFMIELGKYDHLYPKPTLHRIIQNNLPAAWYLLDRAAGPGLTGIVTDQSTQKPLLAHIQIIPRDQNDNIKPRTSDPTTGRYYRPLLPGTYSLTITAPKYQPKSFDNITVTKNTWTSLNCQLIQNHKKIPQ
ncbi:MAG: hypothetical protein GY869_10400 [Planctomycetes bacterium]|nr:hypothetical protein [Planctomycetota bacterium]